jgi:2-methylcitrate dehydratase PrpD
MTTIAERLAAFASETADIPEPVRLSVVKCVFDLMTAAIAGYETLNAVVAREVARDAWGAGPASVWFAGERLPAPGAAFANAAAACSLDLDDGHRTAAGHPGAAVIPAVLAALDVTPTDAARALAAIAVGYEVGVRISAARDLKNVPTTNTGLWGGQAAAAAVGALRGLPPLQIAQAIAIAGQTAPSQSATAYTRFRGNSVKEGIPWAAANGLLAVGLAARGFTGPIDILDERRRFDPGPLLDGLGARWHVTNAYFKPYSCCRWNHAPIDALLALMNEHAIEAADIVAIDVETFGRALTLGNEAAPSTLEGAQYSIPFCLGVAGVRGAPALLPLQEASLVDAAIVELSRKVKLSVIQEFDAMFPAAVPGRVRVTTAAGALERTVLAPKGEPSNPMAWEDVDAKFHAIARDRLAQRTVQRISHAIDGLRNGDIAPLRSALAANAFAAADNA